MLRFHCGGQGQGQEPARERHRVPAAVPAELLIIPTEPLNIK